MSKSIEQAYSIAKEKFAALGIDTDKSIERIHKIPISIHCWQGDDITGFERKGQELSGGIQVTGNYLGKSRNIQELRMDLEFVCKYVPGEKKVNLHAIYLDSEVKPERDEIEPKHFSSWIEWAKKLKIGLDFNPTCFSHPLANDGFTLSHPDSEVRNFWIRHIKQTRKISASFGEALGKKSLNNVWIPDGFKDTPVDLKGPRERLLASLDECFSEDLGNSYNLDVVEGKLFGIGSESYVVGSHEFYLSYALTRKIGLCIDSGHFHPTEKISQKISSISLFMNDILLHVSRPVRWDSDHVVVLNEELVAIFQEVLRNNLEEKVHIGTDYFDASINRIAAWIIGLRNVRKAMLIAALEPTKDLQIKEKNFDLTSRLAYLEELKAMPWQAVWDYYSLRENTGVFLSWIDDVKNYETKYLTKRV